MPIRGHKEIHRIYLSHTSATKDTKLLQRACVSDPILAGIVSTTNTGGIFLNIRDYNISIYETCSSLTTKRKLVGAAYTLEGELLKVALVVRSALQGHLICFFYTYSIKLAQLVSKDIQEVAFKDIAKCTFHGIQTMVAEEVTDNNTTGLGTAIVYTKDNYIKGIPIVMTPQDRQYMEKLAATRDINVINTFPLRRDKPFVVEPEELHITFTALPKDVQLKEIKFSRAIVLLTTDNATTDTDVVVGKKL